jgi:glutathione S-transferase
MLTLFDYPASENAWKVRQLLQHLQRPYRTVHISIFEGEGRSEAYLRISPTGTVPAIQLEDGRTWPNRVRFCFSSPRIRPIFPPMHGVAPRCSNG